MEEYDLAGKVIGCAMKVHSVLGPGFLESVYHNALLCELKSGGFSVASEKKLEVRYRDTVVGLFSADVLVEDQLIVENKAVRALAPEHEVQVVNYLNATGLNEGLLLNFGSRSLQFKKKFRTYRPSSYLKS
jgi:GxxExxY protein